MVTDADGNLTESLQCRKRVFRDYFGKELLGGNDTSFEEHLLNDRARADAKSEDGVMFPFDSSACPSILKLVRGCMSRNPNKAIAEFGVGPDVVSSFSKAIADEIMPITFVSSMIVSKPIQHRGGQLHELLKKGDPHLQEKLP